MSTNTYQTTSLPAISIRGYAGSAPTQHEIINVVGPLFGRLLATMQQLGLDTDQPTIAWYGGSGEHTDLGVGFPADQVPDGASVPADLESTHLDAVERAVVVRHTGGLDGIGPAWSALHQHLAESGLTPVGPCREIYLGGSMDRPDSWVIDLQQPVA